MRSRWLTALLVLQCLRYATACSSHSQKSASLETASGDGQSLRQWDEAQPQHQRRHLWAATAAIKVKHIKRRDCGAEKPSSETQQSVQRLISPHVAQIQQMAANNRIAAAPTVVGVYFHILRAGEPSRCLQLVSCCSSVLVWCQD